MKKILKEFKDFAVQGNVVDIAVGVIVGGAFSKIVTSLVSDVIMPALSVITSRVHIKNLAVTIMSAGDASEPIKIAYGLFLQNIIDFLIIALCLFFTVKMLNRFKRTQADYPPNPAASSEQELLTEIRDILKTRQE